MKEHNCPVCGRPGLEDFRKKEILCPTCESDLSVFVALSQNTSKSNNYRNIIIASLMFALVTMLFLFYSSNKIKKELNVQLFENKQTIVHINDSLFENKQTITQLKDSIIDIQAKFSNIISEYDKYYYTVKAGDSFCLISYCIFGSERYAKEIAELNELNINSKIFPGAKFKIPQK